MIGTPTRRRRRQATTGTPRSASTSAASGSRTPADVRGLGRESAQQRGHPHPRRRPDPHPPVRHRARRARTRRSAGTSTYGGWERRRGLVQALGRHTSTRPATSAATKTGDRALGAERRAADRQHLATTARRTATSSRSALLPEGEEIGEPPSVARAGSDRASRTDGGRAPSPTTATSRPSDRDRAGRPTPTTVAGDDTGDRRADGDDSVHAP